MPSSTGNRLQHYFRPSTDAHLEMELGEILGGADDNRYVSRWHFADIHLDTTYRYARSDGLKIISRYVSRYIIYLDISMNIWCNARPPLPSTTGATHGLRGDVQT
jgi:hypothetical protein